VTVWSGATEACREFAERREKHSGLPHLTLHGVSHADRVERAGRELCAALGEGGEQCGGLHGSLLACSAYAHDVGMFVTPQELNALSLNAATLREYLDPGGAAGLSMRLRQFASYFEKYGEGKSIVEWGRLMVPSASIGASDMRHFVRFLRVIHPWVSREITRRELSSFVSGCVEDARAFASVVSDVALLHWGFARLDLPPAQLSGRVIDVSFWGAVLRLADALDITRERVSGVDVEGLLSFDAGYAANIAFKVAECVSVSKSAITIHLRADAARGEILGFLLVEMGDNLYYDYASVQSFLGSRGVTLPRVYVSAGRRAADITPHLKTLNAAHSAATARREGGESQYVERLREGGAPARYIDALARGGHTPIDALAVASLSRAALREITDMVLETLESSARDTLTRLLSLLSAPPE
jgi:hypothetical protein